MKQNELLTNKQQNFFKNQVQLYDVLFELQIRDLSLLEKQVALNCYDKFKNLLEKKFIELNEVGMYEI